MEHSADQENLIRQYLLGELSEEDKARVEERFLADDEYFAQIQAMEQDLIDDYVRDALSQAERAQFERRYLAAPEGRREIQFARVWQRNAAPLPAAEAPATARPAPVSWWQALLALLRPQSPVMRFAVAAIGLVVIVGGPWLIVETTGLRRQLARLETELRTAQQTSGQLQEQIAKEKAKTGELDKQAQSERMEIARLEQELAKPPSILDLRLTAERSALEGPTKLAVPPGNHWVYVEINLGGAAEYPSYSVELRTPAGAVIHSQDRLTAVKTSSGDRAITLTLSSRLLTPGEYKIMLMGMAARRPEPVGEYLFRVTGK